MRRPAKSALLATVILIGFTISSAVAAVESPCAGDCPLQTPVGCGCSQAEEPIDYNQAGVDCPLPECCSGGHLLAGDAAVVADSRVGSLDSKPLAIAPALASADYQAPRALRRQRAKAIPPPLISSRRSPILQL